VALNEDLEKINQWANKWHVDFSPPKTEELLVTRKRVIVDHPQALLDSVPIKRVDSHKHLGLIITKDLTWKDQITESIDKANRRLGIMRSLKYKLDRLSLERIYKGFIRPILEYGDIVWDTPGDLADRLEVVQLNAARVVIGATAKCSTQGLYDETAWEPLSNRRVFHRLVLMYKIINGKAPQYLSELIPNLVLNRTGYMLRNRFQLDTPLTRLNCYKNSFIPLTTRLWNDLSNIKKSLPSIEAFKADHARSLPLKNPLYFFGTRLETAIHARMRIENSPLKADLCKVLHVIQSPLCPWGCGVEENVKHFFFECPKYDTHRQTLVNDLLPYTVDDESHLLFGIPSTDHLVNIHVFTAVHKYIRETKRFY
jgi:hypothetical protein